VPSDVRGTYCLSYERIGQHGAACPQGVVSRTRAAKPDEYQELKLELERIGYTLKVCQRIPMHAYEKRVRSIKR